MRVLWSIVLTTSSSRNNCAGIVLVLNADSNRTSSSRLKTWSNQARQQGSVRSQRGASARHVVPQPADSLRTQANRGMCCKSQQRYAGRRCHTRLFLTTSALPIRCSSSLTRWLTVDRVICNLRPPHQNCPVRSRALRRPAGCHPTAV